MTLIADVINSHLPARKKMTPSGWISFSAVCCHHRGHRRDTKGRAGIIQENDVISYSCFNCGFKASWQQGNKINKKFTQLLYYLGVPDDLIKKLSLDVLKLFSSETEKYNTHLPNFKTIELPQGSDTLKNITNKNIIPVLEYMVKRNLYETDLDYYWTDEIILRDRLIIPFTYDNKIVGYTARTCKQNKTPKYLTSSQPGYVFNLDKQKYTHPWVIATEGPIDAIHINGIAILGSDINDKQKLLIETLKKNVLIVPDRDKSGEKLILQAIENEWSVSMPPWHYGINDISDAVDRYGRLLTLYSIMKYKYSSKLKIKLNMKSWLKENK